MPATRFTLGALSAGLEPMLDMLPQHRRAYRIGQLGRAVIEFGERQFDACLLTHEHRLLQSSLQFITQTLLRASNRQFAP